MGMNVNALLQQQPNQNSVAIGNRGATANIPPLPDTPENRAMEQEILRQMRDPSTELGGYGIAELSSPRKPQGLERAA